MQSLIQNADFVVCLALETTATSNNLRRLFATPADRLAELTGGAKKEAAPAIADLSAFLAQNPNVVPRLVHLDWCVCSVKDFKVLDSAHAIVKPGVDLDAASQAQTKLTQDVVNSQGVPFAQALEKVSHRTKSLLSASKVVSNLCMWHAPRATNWLKNQQKKLAS